MSLLQRFGANRMPRPGEVVEVYQHNRLLARGTVIAVDRQTVSIAGEDGLIDLDTQELQRGLGDGSIRVRRYRAGRF